jgi:hypothetical protein
VRFLVALGVLLSCVATALVGVREQSENRRLGYRVWDAMRRRDQLEKQVRELRSRIDETLSPRRLLEGQDAARTAGGVR